MFKYRLNFNTCTTFISHKEHATHHQAIMSFTLIIFLLPLLVINGAVVLGPPVILDCFLVIGVSLDGVENKNGILDTSSNGKNGRKGKERVRMTRLANRTNQ